MATTSPRIYLNGRFVGEDEAKVSVFDRCFLYGDGIFEGVAVWDRAPFRLQPHLDRMRDGLDYLRIPNPFTDVEWEDLIERTIAENAMEDGYLRIQISRGEGISSIKWEPRLLKKAEPNVTVIPIRGFKDYYKGLIAEKMEAGLRAIFLSRPRVSTAALPSGTKHCNYLNSVLGAIEVTSSGHDIGIAVDREGFVSEGIAYNVFALKGNRLMTAPISRDILPGITRAVVIELARAEGLEVDECLFDAFTLSSADEVFICSTLELAVPVVEVDGRRIGTGKPGPVSRRLGGLLTETMAGEAATWHASRKKKG
ncbi:branched-chain amino acid aminotransferase [Rhodobacter sp. SGA-6-6]|uniref:aminotransferase class IV n=1 Tax=Rhodobacter sp. SGA-6-6 TaxID=2710882 RepID=UPI0013EA18FC|nr:aminotransferase class IV [Rhodobacter sp. SGA-6-6]NGM47787.1 branched-chain amino acid aminotransferase [Rhodobacter sp. SGA-6-6]